MASEMLDWENYAAVLARPLGVTLEQGWKAAVSANLETIFKMAALLDAFELPDTIDPAPIFEA